MSSSSIAFSLFKLSIYSAVLAGSVVVAYFPSLAAAAVLIFSETK